MITHPLLEVIAGGFRRGELVGLQWPDVSYEDNPIIINRNIPIMRKGTATVKDPKTKSSKAPVEMPQWYMDLLKEYHHEWKKSYLKDQDVWQEGEINSSFHAGLGKPIYLLSLPNGGVSARSGTV